MRSNKRIYKLAFLDNLIPANIRQNDSEYFKAKSLILIVATLVLLSIVSMSAIIAVESTVPYRRLITITLISLQIVAIWLMWMKKRTWEASWFVVIMLSITIMYIDYNNSSFKGAFSIIWVLPPTITVMLLGEHAASKVSIASMLAMGLNFYLLKINALPEPISAPEKWINIEFIVSITIMLIVSFSVYFLSRVTKLKERELSLEIESRKRIAIELEDARDLAEQAAKNKSMFLATMSHELRTPLNSILGNAELLSLEKFEEKTEFRINDIHSAGQLLLTIINDVLDLSKFDTYGIELTNKAYDLSEQLIQIHRMMEAKVKSGVNFVLTGAEQPIYIQADQNRLSQVILNLVSNAVKFTEKGQITLSLTCETDSIILAVHDTGVGISAEDARNLFQDFVQVRKHANRQVEGTGLGLAIIQRIIDRMSGTISLDSEEGKGSTFTVTLPMEFVSQAEVVSEESAVDTDISDDVLVDEQNLSNLSLLIVDDVAMNCIILKALLEELGITTIVEESDGDDAVERIRKDSSFDMILMDVRMPRMDGLEASTLIRELGYTKPIVAVTANAFEEDKQACIKAGMSAFLSKPIELEKLLGVLQHAAVMAPHLK